jgi:hypothetical protein
MKGKSKSGGKKGKRVPTLTSTTKSPNLKGQVAAKGPYK